MKKTDRQRAKECAWKAFAIFIKVRDCLFTTRTRDRGKCISCGFEFPIEKLDAGHYISGRGGAVLFSEEGVHAQCKVCNGIKHGNQLHYRRAIID